MSTLFKKLLFIFIALGLSFQVLAEGKKLYSENEFLDAFGSKSKEKVLQILGEPVRKEMSVKPTNASSVIGRPTEDRAGVSKRILRCGTTIILLNLTKKIPGNRLSSQLWMVRFTTSASLIAVNTDGWLKRQRAT